MTITMSTTLEALYKKIANHDPEAYEWIILWLQHINNVDDIIDGDIRDSESVLKAFVEAQDLVLHPFFDRHRIKLYPIHILAANAYADSNLWNKSNSSYKQTIADTLRSYGNEMLLVVAGICSPKDVKPWDRLREISPILRELSYKVHHTPEGSPV